MNPLRILIAEDKTVIAMLLGEVLVGLGYNICASVTTADEAVAAALFHKPDLIIKDAGLRDSSGVGAITTIMASTPTHHIFISGDKAAVLLRRPGALVIEKPFDEATLVAHIKTAVSN